jgi:hypothetical protein
MPLQAIPLAVMALAETPFFLCPQRDNFHANNVITEEQTLLPNR